MKKLIIKVTAIATFIALCAPSVWSEAPRGYYDNCEGLSGKNLLSRLCDVVGSHTNVGYDGLWEVYKTSDVDENGLIWDMYSTKRWKTDASQRCGNYSLVGDCYNREHSMPKSWFNDAQPMYSDAYHLYPTDGKVNGQRSNFPYGECANGTTLPANGNVKALGKLGTSTFPGYTGKVFEPVDEYKGDFARSYFYMAAAYNDKIKNWNSDMLAGNSYPAFTSWAVDLLLKWSRMDPVSQKELDRNEAVSKHQHNRNPFIDHPEMAEHIWGTKMGEPWSADASAPASLSTPVPGSTVDLGLSSVGVTLTVAVAVKGIHFDSDVKVSVTGTGFSASASKLTASAVNAGTELSVSFKSGSAGTFKGRLTFAWGNQSESVNLTCTAVDGLPAGPATDITDCSFVARWTCIDNPGTKYTLTVKSPVGTLPGYPVSVEATTEQYEVTGLEPQTTYTYTVSSATATSVPVSVTTADPVPDVRFYFDGSLVFEAVPGVPSDVAELLVETDNVSGNINVSVSAPFQLSTDKDTWTTSLDLLPAEDRFYMRVFSQNAGKFYTSIVAKADGYTFDDATATAVVSADGASFHEDFENEGSYGNYNEKTYEGTAATWLTNAYFATGNNNYPHTGQQAARMAKDAPGFLTMLTDKPDGIGSVVFWARLWGKESTSVPMQVYASADNGASWELIETISIEPTPDSSGTNCYTEYSVAVNRLDATRIKLQQTIKSRTLIDDLRLTNASSGSVKSVYDYEYHAWDAYCRAGQLMIESRETSADAVSVYSIDGSMIYSNTLTEGTLALDVTPGMYVVVVRDFSRRVVVK